MKKLFWTLCISTIVGSTPVSAEEVLGEMGVQRILLEPSFSLREPKRAEFVLEKALVGFRWKNDAYWWADVTIGNLELIGKPSRYGEELSGLGLVEGYGEFASGIGNFRAGLLPIDFALEGGAREEQLMFPRSLIYQKRLLGIRDVGLNYFVNNGYAFTSLTVHNGEGGSDLDNRTWFTAKWAYIAKDQEIGISAQVGQTSPESTNSVLDPTLDEFFTSTEKHKMRLSALYGERQYKQWSYGFKTYLAEILSDSTNNNAKTLQFGGATLDLSFSYGSSADILLRYDEIRSYPLTGRHKEMQVILGLALHNWNETSSFLIYAIKNLSEVKEVSDDQLLLTWRYAPRGKK